MMTKLTGLLILSLLALSGALAHADIVTLKDGTTHEGTVIKENRAEVVLEIVISNIKTTKKFARYKVKSIEYTNDEGITETDPQSTPPATVPQKESQRDSDPTARATRAPRAASVIAMQVHVKGSIGEEFNSRGLRAALESAVKEDIEHIVFLLDCEPGYLYDSLDMLRLLIEYDEHFTYYSYVTKPLPTSAYVFLAAADRVFVNPRIKLGGNCDYSQLAFGGDLLDEPYRVDLPYRDDWSSELLAVAERTGKSSRFFVTDNHSYEQPVLIHDKQPIDQRTGRPAVRRVYCYSVPVTTGKELIEAEVAEQVSGSPSKLGATLGIDGWRVRRDIADRAMRAEVKAAKDLAKRYAIAKAYFDQNMVEFSRNDPRDGHYEYMPPRDRYGNYRYDLPLLPKGQHLRDWKNKSDTAIRAYDILIAAHEEMIEITRDGQAAGMKHALMPLIEEGHLEKLREERDWIDENRDEIPTKYLKQPSVKGSP